MPRTGGARVDFTEKEVYRVLALVMSVPPGRCIISKAIEKHLGLKGSWHVQDIVHYIRVELRLPVCALIGYWWNDEIAETGNWLAGRGRRQSEGGEALLAIAAGAEPNPNPRTVEEYLNAREANKTTSERVVRKSWEPDPL